MERQGDDRYRTRINDAFVTRIIDAPQSALPQPEVLPGSHLYPFLQPPEERDEIGRLGNYRVLDLLGDGGMGLVFRAEDLTLRRPVALKVMKPDLEAGKGQAWQRFLREARALAANRHEHVATIYQVGQEGDIIYLAMELLEGLTLEDWCQRVGQPHPGDIVHIGRQIALGLAAIHACGHIHRDIKPSNIWVEIRSQEPGGRRPEKGGDSQGIGDRSQESPHDSTPGTTSASSPAPPAPCPLRPDSCPPTSVSRSLSQDVRVKILDFGLARDTHEQTQLTETGIVVGTPAYLSPEQARAKPIDARSDLFSLGGVLYRMSTGRLPFPAENALDQLAMLAAEEPAPVQDANPDIPDALAQLITRLLAKKPEDRPDSAALVAEELGEMDAALPKLPRSVNQDKTERMPVVPLHKRSQGLGPSWWRRHRVKLGIGAVLGLATLGVVIGLVYVFGIIFAEKRTFLTELRKVQAVNWPFHKTKKGEGHKGPPPELFEIITVEGKTSPHGIFMHPAPPFEEPASITFHLDRKYRRFQALATLNDSSPASPSPLTFAVYGDNQLLWQAPDIVWQEQGTKCEIDVEGVNLLRLEVTSAGDVRKAHSVWVEPSLSK